MINYVIAKGQKLYLDNREQKGISERPFRHSGTEIVTTEPNIYVKEFNMFMHKTIYSFIYLDEIGGIFRLKFDQQGNFEHKL